MLWVALSLLFIGQPAALTPGISFPVDLTAADIGAFWSARPDRSLVHVGLHVTALVTALVMILLVARVSTRIGPAVRWSSRLATLGLAVTAVSNARYLAMERTYARLFAEAAPGARPDVAVASASLALDPYGILEFGLLAFWLVSLARHAARGPAPLFVAAAVVAAAGFLGMVVGAVGWQPALDLAPLLGTPALVLWLFLLPGVVDAGKPDPARTPAGPPDAPSGTGTRP